MDVYRGEFFEAVGEGVSLLLAKVAKPSGFYLDLSQALPVSAYILEQVTIYASVSSSVKR